MKIEITYYIEHDGNEIDLASEITTSISELTEDTLEEYFENSKTACHLEDCMFYGSSHGYMDYRNYLKDDYGIETDESLDLLYRIEIRFERTNCVRHF